MFSHLLKKRILLIGQELDDALANEVVSQLIYLAADNSTADITLYINTPGGSVQAGLAIFDAMQYIPCAVSTVGLGAVASMGAFLLASGAAGKRKAFPNARIMMHQPLGGCQGSVGAVSEILYSLSR